jgi:hypothetical protein
MPSAIVVLPITVCLWSPSDPAATSSSSTCVPRASMAHQLTSSTTGSPPHHHSPPSTHQCCHELQPDELPSFPLPQICPPRYRPALVAVLGPPHRREWPESAERRLRVMDSPPPLFFGWAASATGFGLAK